MKKHRKSIYLYTFETNCSQNARDWKEVKALEGTTVDCYPSNSCQSFTSFKKAKKTAKTDAHFHLCGAYRQWYYVIKFEVLGDYVSRMFDGIEGMEDTPRCKIKKVFPIKYVDQDPNYEEVEMPKEQDDEEYVEETMHIQKGHL